MITQLAGVADERTFSVALPLSSTNGVAEDDGASWSHSCRDELAGTGTSEDELDGA